MRLEDWETCESLFHRARELPEQDRQAFLDAHCPAGSEFRRLLESLLRHDEDKGDFLIPPATAAISTDSSRVRQEEIAVPLLAGSNLGAYRLVRFLGSGAIGEVWEAEDSPTGRRVALKVLVPRPLTTALPPANPRLASFYREGQLAARIHHPRMVYVFGAEEIQGLPVISMELMRGGTLDDKLRVAGTLGVSQAVDFILDIIGGLEAAQQVGLLHRDIKPSNCFIDDEGRARIGDFGIAMTLQSSGRFAGTAAFASPEQVSGSDVDVRSDIYSVGATLYTLLTGKLPLSDSPVPFSLHGARIPRDLRRVLDRCLAKDRDKRYPGYAALRKDLLPLSSVAPGNLAGRLRVIAGRRGENPALETLGLREPPDSGVAAERPRCGPFEILQKIWEKGDESLVLAFDPMLWRYVWIHTSKSNPEAISDRLAAVRPGKLQWLQGSREGLHWNAFELLRGESLPDRVRNRGCLSWSQTVSVLVAVTREVEARIEAGERAPLSLEHIWINPSPRSNALAAKILEFPAAISEKTASMSRVDAGNAKDFVYSILVFALTGTTPVDRSAGLHVPLPEEARAFVSRLESGQQFPIGSLRHELRRLTAQPAEIRLPRRAAMLAASVSLTLALWIIGAALTALRGIDVLFWGGGMLWIVPVLLATAFPPGVCARAMGVSLQTVRGQAPTALRRLLRSVCAWFPFVAFYPMLLAAAYLGYAPGATAHWKKEGVVAATLQLHGYSGILGTVDALLLGLFGLGIVFALVKPPRGLPDLIAGTCLVPK